MYIIFVHMFILHLHFLPRIHNMSLLFQKYARLYHKALQLFPLSIMQNLFLNRINEDFYFESSVEYILYTTQGYRFVTF